MKKPDYSETVAGNLEDEAVVISEWWSTNRWKNTKRDYEPMDVAKLTGSYLIRNSIAEMNADKLWYLLNSWNQPVRALGALTGNQAVQQVAAGLEAIYLSGWQVAADNNLTGQMYPDQSLYPSNSVPNVIESINNALMRADKIERAEGTDSRDWLVPIVADAEAGFGGNLNAFELMKLMIKAGAAGVHFEDQLSSAKKCGHLGGKVLVPTSEFVNKLKSARLAADTMYCNTIIIARTDANSARLLTSDIDERDRVFITNDERTSEGFYHISGGLDMAIARGLAYAPYADLLWCETSYPDLEEAKRFADAIHAVYPDQMLAYNCSPSFNWSANIDKTGPLEEFQNELFKMGYKFQFITLAGFHALNLSMFELAQNYKESGMLAYSKMQDREFDQQSNGFGAVKHQQFVGTSYFDAVTKTISKDASTSAMEGSTEEDQF